MVLAFLLVFFGIRSFRDDAGGGAITFARGFAVGISITLDLLRLLCRQIWTFSPIHSSCPASWTNTPPI